SPQGGRRIRKPLKRQRLRSPRGKVFCFAGATLSSDPLAAFSHYRLPPFFSEKVLTFSKKCAKFSILKAATKICVSGKIPREGPDC
ncbi:MAG: hypothetical protein Q4F17_09815, partial [Eubacteriales bacterium]|nr:hypothetical protein [Eubacteriales bacterium]